MPIQTVQTLKTNLLQADNKNLQDSKQFNSPIQRNRMNLFKKDQNTVVSSPEPQIA